MKKLLTILTLVTVSLLFVGCDPDTSGVVIDKRYTYFGGDPDYFIFEIRIKGVVPHGEVIWWKVVSADIWTNCQVGEHWDIDDPDGCPD